MSKIKYLGVYVTLLLYMVLEVIVSYFYPNQYSFVINPIFFIAMAIIIYNISDFSIRSPKDKEHLKRMLILMLTYFICYEMLGLFLGFVRNPYSLKFVSIIKNAWQFIIPIICIEYIRSFIVNVNYKNKTAIVVFTIIIFLIELNINNVVLNMNGNEKIFAYFSSVFLPLLAYEALYSYLSFKSSFKIVLIMRLIFETIKLYIPIHPDIDWFATGIIGIVFPTISYFFFKYYYDKRRRNTTRLRSKNINPAAYIPVFAFIFLIAGFMLGIFNYLPISIASNSMNPIFYRGDAVVMRKVNANEVKNIEINDIIIYSKDKQVIVHRVIDKIEKDKKIYYQTKGDNNNAPDVKLVSEGQVKGVYRFSVKYIGYPSIWLSELLKDEKPTVEIK